MNDILTHRNDVLARLSRRNRWYAVTNPTGPVAEIRIYDEIWFGGVTAENFAADLDAITAPEILVAINSPGGDVFDAIAIYNALRNHPAQITTRVDGVAASAASLIVQAGDTRIMMSSSQMMIHEPWGMAVGPASEIRAFADLLDRQTEVLAGIYAGRSDKDAAHYQELMAGGMDIWFTAEETVAEGLADEIENPNPKTQAANKQKILADQISETVVAVAEVIESAERVAALRAEKGKTLSKVNAESLDGLREYLERLEHLLTPPEQTPPQQTMNAADVRLLLDRLAL